MLHHSNMNNQYNIPVTLENLHIALDIYFSIHRNGSKDILNKIEEQLSLEYSFVKMNDIDSNCRDAILNLDNVLAKHDCKMDKCSILDMVLAAYIPTWGRVYGTSKIQMEKISRCITDLRKLKYIANK